MRRNVTRRTSDQLGKRKRREIAGRMILRHRDLVAEMFGWLGSVVVQSTHRGRPRAHTHTHTYILAKASCRHTCECVLHIIRTVSALTRAPCQVPGDAAAPVCSRCQTLWRLGVLQATPPFPLFLTLTSSSFFSSFSIDLSFSPRLSPFS